MIITVSRGLIELARAKEKQGSSRETLLHTERVVSNSLLLSPLVLLPSPRPGQAWSTHSLLGQSLGYPAMRPRYTPRLSHLNVWRPHWPGVGLSPALGENLVVTFSNSDRYIPFFDSCQFAITWMTDTKLNTYSKCFKLESVTFNIR